MGLLQRFLDDAGDFEKTLAGDGWTRLARHFAGAGAELAAWQREDRSALDPSYT